MPKLQLNKTKLKLPSKRSLEPIIISDAKNLITGYITCQSLDLAKEIASTIVEENLCIHVNIVPGVVSVARDGSEEPDEDGDRVSTKDKFMLMVKTTKKIYPYLE